MAGGIAEGKAVFLSVFFKKCFSLKACFVCRMGGVAFACDDVSFFRLEEGAFVVHGFAVVIVSSGQRYGSFPKIFRAKTKNPTCIRTLSAYTYSVRALYACNIIYAHRTKNSTANIMLE